MEDIKILLVCAAGTSTSLLVKKMHQQAKKNHKNYEIDALGQTLARGAAQNYDVILLAPGLKFILKQFAAEFPDKAISFIDAKVYAISDANAVLVEVEELYKEKYNKV